MSRGDINGIDINEDGVDRKDITCKTGSGWESISESTWADYFKAHQRVRSLQASKKLAH